jgi:7,8-dihydropterin-6-yl-methyl-4-(beta-D-ribofuranosyl)aminobenzene 5'-phosphate synthase
MQDGGEMGILSFRKFLQICLLLILAMFSIPSKAADKVTILYDAFGDAPTMTKDWGFSALIEHEGKRILFDSGNNAEIFEHNVKALGVDLTKLDFAVMSHRHHDHITGLNYLLRINPYVTVYAPSDGANGFGGGPIPPAYFRPDATLPDNMRYFDGKYPEHATSGKLYDTANIVLVNKLTEVSPGIYLVFTVSQKKGTLELPELTLAIKRPNGLMLVDGCSHAGVEAILEAASPIDTRFEILFGGLHLVTAPLDEIGATLGNLKSKWKLQRIAPGHCTGEPAFAQLKKAYGENYIYAGVGTTITLN